MSKITKNSSSIPGSDDITRVELPNGIVVLARSNFNSPSVTINGYLTVGSLVDSDEQLGLSDFTAAALMRGTAPRDFKALYDDLESVGAGLSYRGGTHTTGFSGRALVEDLDLLLGILAETLRQPAFPKKQMEKLRAQILTGLALRDQNTSDRAAMAFDKIVYADHPYSRNDEGLQETVKNIHQKDLVGHHARYYGPTGMRVVVVGGIDAQEAVDRVQAALGDWENPGQPPMPDLPELSPLDGAHSTRVDLPGKSQSDLVVGAAGPPRRAPDFVAAALGNSVFGQFGMMGRIGEALREQAGLAYYAYSSLSGSIGPGPWAVTAGVNPKNERRAIELIKKEVSRFVTELVAEEELTDSQANFIGRLPLSLEANAGVAAAILHLEKHKLGLDYYRKYPERVRAVSREDVLAAAANYLDPECLAVAIAGPPKEGKE